MFEGKKCNITRRATTENAEIARQQLNHDLQLFCRCPESLVINHAKGFDYSIVTKRGNETHVNILVCLFNECESGKTVDWLQIDCSGELRRQRSAKQKMQVAAALSISIG